MERKLEGAKSSIKELMEFLLERARSFDVFDWAVLKILLVSLGVIIGSSFSKTFKKLKPLIWAVTLITYIWTMYKIFEPILKTLFKELREKYN